MKILITPNKLSTVVIVGRTNVGKSFLFNRLTESGKALVSEIEHTTRDYNTGKVNWRTKTFTLIDTGGVNIENLKKSIQSLLPGKKVKSLDQVDLIEKEIIEQTKLALAKADLLLMVADGKAGLNFEDKELALVLKKLGKPVFLIVNKIDRLKLHHQVNEFFKLGLGKPFPVSAANGSGTGDMLDELIKKIKGQKGRPKKEAGEKPVRIAIIGKPNVGKSSLINKVLGEKRVIVSPMPQTTREPQDTAISYQDKKIILIDTAGLKKQAKIAPGLDSLASRRTLGVLKRASVILFVTDASQPISKQDAALVGLMKDAGAGIILVANKWDLIPGKTDKSDNLVRSYYQRAFPFLSFAPIIFTSALTGRNVEKILDLALAVNREREKEVSDEDLKTVLKTVIKRQYPAPAEGEKQPHLLSLKQTKTNPPEFTLLLGPKQSLHFSYIRLIENQIRQNLGFLGVPVAVKVDNVKH